MVNSIKQIFRTPLKLVILIISMIINAVILVSGFTLLFHTNSELNSIEKSYTTIGTVEQKKSSTEDYSIWDAATETYSHYQIPIYDKFISKDILNIKKIKYIEKPEKRPYYGAYMPGYLKSMDERVRGFDLYLTIEFSPVETCVPNKPVLVNIKKVLMGDVHNSSQLWLCDHMTEEPDTLEAGKTYISTLMYKDNTHTKNEIGTSVEWYPIKILPVTTQRDKAGNILPNSVNVMQGSSWEVVTEDFYESDRGRYWLNLVSSYHMLRDMIPVLPTNSMVLLPSFHSKSAQIVSGREISKTEFQKGKKVCLISKEFADLNGLKEGDKVNLPLYFSDYNNSSSHTFEIGCDFSLLNAKGEIYSAFSEHEYEIVGIYQYQNIGSVSAMGKSEITYDQIIIPSKSVKESDEDNIVDVGPMKYATTSFQIPNGTIKEYEALFSKEEKSDFLEIHFDDNGYEKIKNEIIENRILAYMLCCFGILSVIIVILLLLYFFIVRQKKRIAIERAMGANKKQCRISMVGGLGVFVLTATIIGSILGSALLNTTLYTERRGTYFSTKYSSSQKNMELILPSNIELSFVEMAAVVVTLSLILTFIVVILAIYLVDRQFKSDLVILLGDKES